VICVISVSCRKPTKTETNHLKNAFWVREELRWPVCVEQLSLPLSPFWTFVLVRDP
jgi:hypothetical protein